MRTNGLSSSGAAGGATGVAFSQGGQGSRLSTATSDAPTPSGLGIMVEVIGGDSWGDTGSVEDSRCFAGASRSRPGKGLAGTPAKAKLGSGTGKRSLQPCTRRAIIPLCCMEREPARRESGDCSPYHFANPQASLASLLNAALTEKL